jgi:hypothetical protein
MRPMRFPRRFPWLIALVLLSFSGVLFLPLGLWYWLAYPPVQHYYLGASCESAFVGDHSTMAVPVQWLSRGDGPVLPSCHANVLVANR